MERVNFLDLWTSVRDVFNEVTKKYDDCWRVRKRTIDSRFLTLFILKLVVDKDKRGYGCVLVEIFNQFVNAEMHSTHQRSPAASSVCEARQKLDALIFKELNTRILDLWDKHSVKDKLLWYGHRLYGVDGSRFVVPKELEKHGYRSSGEHIYYPQALVSAVYELQTGFPRDFTIAGHNNERTCAIEHLEHFFQKGDVAVYDRGYFSFELLAAHVKHGVFPIFRLQINTGYKVIEEFWESSKVDEIVLLTPPRAILSSVKKGTLEISPEPIEVRLVKYKMGGNTYVLCTLLKEKTKYPKEIFPDAYHARWGVEEMLKVSKEITGVQDFHAKTEKGIQQELYAHFLSITLTKIVELQSHHEVEKRQEVKTHPKRRLQVIKSQNVRRRFCEKNSNEKQQVGSFKMNMKNCFLSFSRILTRLLYENPQRFVTVAITNVLASSERLYQAIRPYRNYLRASNQSINKWRRVKVKVVHV